MMLGAKWLMQLGIYASNLEEQFTEFPWQGQHYNHMGLNVSSQEK